jgi:hypothetical protein
VEKKQFKELDTVFICFAIRLIIEHTLRLYGVVQCNNPQKFIQYYLQDKRIDRLIGNGKELTNTELFKFFKDKRLKTIYDKCKKELHRMSAVKKKIPIEDFYYVVARFKYVLDDVYTWLSKKEIKDTRKEIKEFLEGKELEKRGVKASFLVWFVGFNEKEDRATAISILLQEDLEKWEKGIRVGR